MPSSSRKLSRSRRIAASRSASLWSEVRGQAQEVEQVGIAEDEVGGQPVLIAHRVQVAGDDDIGALRDGRALEEHPADLRLHRAGAPALDAAHLGVELPLQRIVDGDQLP